MTNSLHEIYQVPVHLDFLFFLLFDVNFKILETSYKILKCQESWSNISPTNIIKTNQCQWNLFKFILWLQFNRQQTFRIKLTEYYAGSRELTGRRPSSLQLSIKGCLSNSMNKWAAESLALAQSGAKELACPRATAPNTIAENTLDRKKKKN